MTDLPRRLRDELATDFTPFGTVLIAISSQSTARTNCCCAARWPGRSSACCCRRRDRRTVCISTQVGCGMGCVFCASGLGGVVRNLTPGEILEQLLQARNLLPPDERLTHIVVMGMGEPLANLDALLEALAVATAPDGLGIGARHVTISTVGLPGARFASSPTSASSIIWPCRCTRPTTSCATASCRPTTRPAWPPFSKRPTTSTQKTGRQVTYEYVLLRDVNDAPEHAAELAGCCAAGRRTST